MARATSTLPTVQEAEALLYREARLLDETRYGDWLQLFTDDGFYWIPVDGHDGEAADSQHDVQIIFDDAQRREERVWRTLNTPVLDQNPRSRTVHSVTNVEVDPEPLETGEAVVRCVQLVAELRPGGLRQVGLNEQRLLAARVEYRLFRIDDDWRIRRKKVNLLNRDLPIFNLTFIF